MSKTKTTSAPAEPKQKKKKNVGSRLLAVLLLAVAACALFVIPFETICKSVWLDPKAAIDGAVKPQTLWTTLTSFPMFEISGILTIVAYAGVILLAGGIALACVLSLLGIFAGKVSLLCMAAFFFTWGVAAHTLSVIAVTCYITRVPVVIDIIGIAVSVLGAFLYALLLLSKRGKEGWAGIGHFFLTLAITGLLLFAMTDNGFALGKAMKANETYKLVIIAIGVLQAIQLVLASWCAMYSKNLKFDAFRFTVQLIVTLGACVVAYLLGLASTFLLYGLIAVVLAFIQLSTCHKQRTKREKVKIEAVAEAKIADFEREEYLEAYAYEGGPVAGVMLAEEVNPTAAALAAQKNYDEAAQATMASLLGNGFDAFLITLSEKEKTEFIDLYVLKCKGLMPEIPGYVVGGDNKDFFNKVFIYLGQYREKIPAELLSKMYSFSMKI